MIQNKELPPPENFYKLRRALLSVYDKRGLVKFARHLDGHGVELVSTGGTARALREAGLPVIDVAELTGFPEILGGRVKTLHPMVYGGLLSRRTDEEDAAELADHGIRAIDLVVVNLYPFAETNSREDVTDRLAIENIDIGGPTMIRAAAKNFFFTAVVVNPDDYQGLEAEMNDNEGCLGMATRRSLAHKAFGHTANYDRTIDDYFGGNLALRINQPLDASLRYGENPHQTAALYGDSGRVFEKLHGKDLSFNNLLDLSAAIRLVAEFKLAPPTCAILKHTNPCGVGTASTLESAYQRAFSTDRQSPFGGIVIVNRELDLGTAKAIDKVFTELIIAPSFTDETLAFLKAKKNRRLILHHPDVVDDSPDIRSVVGGLLVQDHDPPLPSPTEFRGKVSVVTERQPSEEEWGDLDFCWRVAKHVKSNAIVYARNGATLGVGAGQMSRIDASEVAVRKGHKSRLDFSQSVVGSDAFFPFADGLIEAAEAGAIAAIQPGGSIRDAEVIAAANERGMAMVFTGRRHFRH